MKVQNPPKKAINEEALQQLTELVAELQQIEARQKELLAEARLLVKEETIAATKQKLADLSN